MGRAFAVGLKTARDSSRSRPGYYAVDRRALPNASDVRRARCVKDEPGALRFEVLVPNDAPLLYEVYQDVAAFEAVGTDNLLYAYAKKPGA